MHPDSRSRSIVFAVGTAVALRDGGEGSIGQPPRQEAGRPVEPSTQEISGIHPQYRHNEKRKEVAMDDTLVDDELVLAVDSLGDAHDRHEAEQSDPTGTSAGDDGENRDSSP